MEFAKGIIIYETTNTETILFLRMGKNIICDMPFITRIVWFGISNAIMALPMIPSWQSHLNKAIFNGSNKNFEVQVWLLSVTSDTIV